MFCNVKKRATGTAKYQKKSFFMSYKLTTIMYTGCTIIYFLIYLVHKKIYLLFLSKTQSLKIK